MSVQGCDSSQSSALPTCEGLVDCVGGIDGRLSPSLTLSVCIIGASRSPLSPSVHQAIGWPFPPATLRRLEPVPSLVLERFVF